MKRKKGRAKLYKWKERQFLILYGLAHPFIHVRVIL